MTLFKKKTLGTIGYLGGLPTLLEPFCWAWGQMIQYNNEYVCKAGEIIHYIKATASLHFFARNSLVEQMKGDWLLQLDTDHAFDPDILSRMLDVMNTYDLKVVTALYCHKSPPHSPVIYNFAGEGKFAQPIGNWDKKVKALQIESAGAGCLLVKREVFDRIESELKEKPFALIENFGEDHSFFKRLQKLKIPAYALTNIESPHLVITKLQMEDYNFNNSSISKDRREVEGFQ